jgi:hypothetical protein
MEDGSHLLCLFLKDSVYLRPDLTKENFDVVFLLGKVDSDFKEWIQLPTCMTCLEKIECMVSGINYVSCEQLDAKIKPDCGICHRLMNKSVQSKCQDCQ